MKSKIIISFLWLALLFVQAKAEVHTEDPNNTLSIADITTVPDGQFTISVVLKNSVTIGGFEFTLVLPEGFTIGHSVDKYGDVTPYASLSDERTNSTRHTFSADFVGESKSKLKVLCYSTTAKNFAGNDGEVATIVVNVDPEMELGDYNLTLSNVVISNATDTYEDASLTSKISVVDNRCDVNQDGEVNVADVTMVVDFITRKNRRQ